jgi:hypothetical protein
MADVDLIALDGGYVLMTDGKVLPITRLADADGDETDDPYEAVVCVAGEDGYGWLTIAIHPENSSPMEVH